MNIFVTGGLGFIGSNFCVYIINRVNRLVIIDKNNYCSNLQNIDEIKNNSKLIIIQKDIIDTDLVSIFIKYDIDTIIHFAAQTHVDNSYNGFYSFVSDNVLATHILLESCKIYNKLTKILIMSTDEIYGPSTCTKLVETDKFNPTNPYSASKASAEMIVNAYKHSYNLPIIIIRCNNVYGPKQYPEKVIPKFINQILSNKQITIHGNGEKVRDFIYIEDVCRAIKCILDKGIIEEIYNIGSDNPHSILDLAQFLLTKLNKSIQIINVEDRPFNDDRYYVSSQKLSLLGWSPIVTWDEGINSVIKWIIANPNYWKSKEVIIKNINIFKDNRGEMKVFNSLTTQQQFISTSYKNVIRGIHCSTYGKIVTCIKGSVIDYIINMETFTYQKYILIENSQVYIPPNYGHLFVTLENNTQILYQLEGIYNPSCEISIHYKDPYLNLDIDKNTNYILSEKDLQNSFIKPIDYVVLGSSGFLGSYTCKILKEHNKNYIILNTRLEQTELLKSELLLYKPKYLICAAGISGKPTVQWCENNQDETFKVNYTLQIELSKICKDLNIHLTIYGSGLIYSGDDVYSEESTPNKYDLFYSRTRIILEKDLDYTNILYLRILYPISGDSHEKCFLMKLKSRKDSIHNVAINCTILSDLLPHALTLIENRKTGIYNFVNKGLIFLPEILKIIDSSLEYTIIDTNNKIFPQLSIEKLEKDLKCSITDINTALKSIPS